MGTYKLSKSNRLYWLGRYAERALTVIEIMEQAWDKALDGPGFDYADWCHQLDIPCPYVTVDDFFTHYLFDPQDESSAASSLNHAFDNAVVLRETLSSATISYVQLAKNVMDNAAVSMAPLLDLQTVRDYLMAFKGCVDEYVDDEDNRMIIKCGFTVERIDLCLRLNHRIDTLDVQFERLATRLQRTSLARDGKRLRLLNELIPCLDVTANKEILLDCIENMFPDA